MLIPIIIITMISGLIVAALAARKGYNFLIWFLIGGMSLIGLIVGLIALAFLPFANKASTPEEQARLRKQGNTIGMVTASCIAAIVTVVGFVLPWFAVFDLSYFNYGEVSGAQILVNNFNRWPGCLFIGIPVSIVSVVAVAIGKQRHWFALVQMVAAAVAGYSVYAIVNQVKTWPEYKPYVGLSIISVGLGLLLVTGMITLLNTIRRQ